MMIKRRYGIINSKDKFKVSSDRNMFMEYLLKCNIKTPNEYYARSIKYGKAYTPMFEYTCKLAGNIVIGLKGNKKLCVWEMGNKDSTYKEFVI